MVVKGSKKKRYVVMMSDDQDTNEMLENKFVTVINCMDGRVQIPVNTWMQQQYRAAFIDTITEPGPNKILAEQSSGVTAGQIKRKVEISVYKHGSTVIAITGHGDCAGNPTSEEIQKKQIEDAVRTVNSWGFDVTVIGLWIDEQWTVHKLI